MTSRDVKASYERIVNPPEGVVSARKQSYGAIASIEAPDARTIEFKLKYVSPAMLSLFASPWNYIYSAAALEKDPRFPEKNILGTGPFTFVEYVNGSHWVGKRFEDYWDKGKPYLDSFRALFIRETATQEAAVRGERAHIEFRGFTPQARRSPCPTPSWSSWRATARTATPPKPRRARCCERPAFQTASRSSTRTATSPRPTSRSGC